MPAHVYTRRHRPGRLRSEDAERPFARLCWSGATGRLWIRPEQYVAQWYVAGVAGLNLAVITPALFQKRSRERCRGSGGPSPPWLQNPFLFSLRSCELLGGRALHTLGWTGHWQTNLITACRASTQPNHRHRSFFNGNGVLENPF